MLLIPKQKLRSPQAHSLSGRLLSISFLQNLNQVLFIFTTKNLCFSLKILFDEKRFLGLKIAFLGVKNIFSGVKILFKDKKFLGVKIAFLGVKNIFSGVKNIFSGVKILFKDKKFLGVKIAFRSVANYSL